MISLFKQFILNKLSIGAPNVRFGLFSRIGEGSSFEGNNLVGKFSFFSGAMGRYSYVGDNSVIIGNIGRYCSISSNVKVINGRHPMRAPFVSTSPLFYSLHNPFRQSLVTEQLFEEYAYADTESKAQVIIGNDCWIGYGASIIGGVNIRDGAVILANATVTKDVPPYAIVAGIPAKVIAYRYENEIIDALLKRQWWNESEDWIREKFNLFVDLDSFIISKNEN